jgi:DNA-binding CsgD family transcriptional regulator
MGISPHTAHVYAKNLNKIYGVDSRGAPVGLWVPLDAIGADPVAWLASRR